MDLDLEKKGNISKKLADPSGVSQDWEGRLRFFGAGKSSRSLACVQCLPRGNSYFIAREWPRTRAYYSN